MLGGAAGLFSVAQDCGHQPWISAAVKHVTTNSGCASGACAEARL